MTVNYLRDNHNIVIGWTNESETEILGWHIKKQFVGRYNKYANITYDIRGKVYCHGNGVEALIREVNNNTYKL